MNKRRSHFPSIDEHNESSAVEREAISTTMAASETPHPCHLYSQTTQFPYLCIQQKKNPNIEPPPHFTLSNFPISLHLPSCFVAKKGKSICLTTSSKFDFKLKITFYRVRFLHNSHHIWSDTVQALCTMLNFATLWYPLPRCKNIIWNGFFTLRLPSIKVKTHRPRDITRFKLPDVALKGITWLTLF